jgi:hypothetical protein
VDKFGLISPPAAGRGGYGQWVLSCFSSVDLWLAGLMSYFAINRLSFPFMPYGEPKLPFRNDKTLTFS